MIEVNAQMPSVWQRIHVYQVALWLLDLLTLECELLLCERPEFALRRLPVTGGHVSDVGSRSSHE
jgi:hypothetical protein